MRTALLGCLGGAVLLAATACSTSPPPTAGPVVVRLWHHDGTPAEQRVFADQVRGFNASQTRVHVAVRTLAEGDYNDELQAAIAGDVLPDIAEVDGPELHSYVFQDALRPLEHLVAPSALGDQLPSLQAQNREDGHTYAVSAFDSGLGLFADRDQLRAAGVRWPHGIDDAWTAREFSLALRRLARHDPDGKVLDVKANYGAGEWMTYGFAPLVASAGGDLVDPASRRATGHLDGSAANRALGAMSRWSAYVDPNPRDDAFTRGRVAISWSGHWVYDDDARALGKRLLVLPLPDLGHGTKTGQGSWAWAVTSHARHPAAAAAFLEYLLRDREVLRMSRANGAVPGTRVALARSPLYRRHGPLRLFAEQLLRSCGNARPSRACVAVPRPLTPGYPVVTNEFARVVFAAWEGDLDASALSDAAREIDDDVAANHGYRS